MGNKTRYDVEIEIKEDKDQRQYIKRIIVQK